MRLSSITQVMGTQVVIGHLRMILQLAKIQSQKMMWIRRSRPVVSSQEFSLMLAMLVHG